MTLARRPFVRAARSATVNSVEPDFLDAMIAKRTKANPQFPAMMDAARAKRAARLDVHEDERGATVELPDRSGDGAVQILSRRSTAK